ncbi:hypothetical protein A9G42_11370 [Gilliamella sp. Nev6-6]|uniref:hypothetical protein n=1 Tax=unclassified Gilliamella TaxID=2685620 RepID=UPI00080E06CE|nr:hypothetical protein [Gilliamella apicola]OCG60389.1 hypothetical protein A9G40_04520 [Gilliamella apicola]OCG66318.1 hypothetical protein A9G41_00985 [Gilliamella apicola]OCG73792.1 hypothetical protein A9G42_11370 [Gilliamella apicola]
MNISLVINEKPPELDEFLDQDEMELSSFEFALVELSQYINGLIHITFKNGLNVTLDLFSDFLICLDDIINSINAAKLSHTKKETIWFCEQGSDFYLYYEVKDETILLSYKQGKSTGMPNKLLHDFSIEVDSLAYIRNWENIFQALIIVFEEKLQKKIAIPF